MKRLGGVLGASAVLSLVAAIASADLPRRISYQGKLNDQAGVPVNGSVAFTFGLYTAATGGTLLWTENQTLQVSNGIFSTQLGAVVPLPYQTLSLQDAIFLGIRAGADQEMIPRQEITESSLSQIQGEEIAREAVWPVHEGRNNTIRSYYQEGVTAATFVMPADKVFIITDVNFGSLAFQSCGCQISYTLSGVTKKVYAAASMDINAGQNISFDPGRHDSFRSGMPIPAGSTLTISSNSSPSQSVTHCTVAGFEIPSTL